MSDLDRVLAALTAPIAAHAFDDVDGWWADHRAATDGLALPVDRAIVGATRVDRLGWAFAGAYQAALRALLPGGTVPERAMASFAVTEAGGNHPRAIETTLRRTDAGFLLDGTKSWVTLGPASGVVIAIARLDDEAAADRPALRAVRIDGDRRGVSIAPHGDAPFVPEIPHATATFAAVRVAPSDVLPGDGYADYAKPFRTVEDVHVQGATLAWLAGLGARHGWSHEVREALVAAALTARTLATADPRAPATHIGLAASFQTTRDVLDRLDGEWPRVDEPTRRSWERDRALLAVAGGARARRREVAWSRVDPR